ncbi:MULTISPECIES: hypothetical protein [unclassified Helicobacter]|uniref:hypothetical protein n=1 Tax=unclassified Helicobacter TaxID=2593540 RepID=UPI000CF02AC3|nr:MULTISPECIES: hypothetical protein [unclassified Helicobacter]
MSFLKFLSPGFFILAFWTLIFFGLFAFVVWYAYDEILKVVSLIGNQIVLDEDKHKTLEQLVAESKLISAKDYFGFYISYYNNFVLILSAIVGLFGISSFIYLKRKNDDIDTNTKKEIKNYLSKEIDVKKLTQEVVNAYVASQMKEKFEIVEKDIDMLKKQVEQIEILNLGNEEMILENKK